MVMVWKDHKSVLLKYLSPAPLLSILLAAKWIVWWGGGSYGPRLLADSTPFLCLYLYPPFERVRSRPFLKYAVATLVVLSVGLHALKVFGGGDWNGHPLVDRHPERLWLWADSPPVYYGRNAVLDAWAEIKRRLLALPTSRTDPSRLAASYRLTSVAPGTSVRPGEFLLCQLLTDNVGEAVWLDHVPWEKGEVRLRWRWFEEGPEHLVGEGGRILGYDVLPGQTYEFTLEIPAPHKPGSYLLELGLMSMGVTAFADQGTVPLRIPIAVVGQPAGG
jgi:hypothetical protein